MRAEFKLLAGCLTALLVGALVVTPLIFSMLGTTKAQTNSEPYFDAKMEYAFLRFSDNGSDSTREHGIALNTTLEVEKEAELPDAMISYFLVQVYSDNGPVENLTFYQGAAYNNSFSTEQFNSFIFSNDTWFGNQTGGGGGSFYFNATPNQSFILSGGGEYSSNGSKAALPGGQIPHEVSINLTRLGSVIFKGTSTVISQANEGFIEHVQLGKYQDGFLYNIIIPSDQVDQINELNPKISITP